MSRTHIPAILHQTWKDEVVPPQWQQFHASWKRLHPVWEHRLWTDEANRRFVAEHYPALLPTYDGYSYGIQRADVIRYCILHHFGGVYVDMDMECLLPLDSMLHAGGFVGVYEPPLQARWLGLSSLLSNAFLASTPRHPFLARVIAELASNPRPGLTHVDVLASTGPVFLHRVFETYEGDDVTVLPPHAFFPFLGKAPELQTLQSSTEEAHALRASLVETGTYAVHYWANSWVDLAGELVNPDPHHVAGYDFYPGLDSPGNDLANVGRDVVRAAQACTRMAGAVAFNTDGFVKSRLLPRDQWLPSRGDPAISGLYVRRRDGPLASLRRLSSGIFGRR